MAQSLTRRAVYTLAEALALSLTTTSATNLFGEPVTVRGRKRVVTLNGSIGVVTAATAMTVAITYTDANTGKSETIYAYTPAGTAVDALSVAVGVQPFSATFPCLDASTITVNVTAGTASQATVSGELRGS